MSQNINSDINFDTTGGLMGSEYVYNFLKFIDSDTSGKISKEQLTHHIAIKSFIAKHTFALNIYKEFIKTSESSFPSYDNLIQIIDNITNGFRPSYITPLNFFCIQLWTAIHH